MPARCPQSRCLPSTAHSTPRTAPRMVLQELRPCVYQLPDSAALWATTTCRTGRLTTAPSSAAPSSLPAVYGSPHHQWAPGILASASSMDAPSGSPHAIMTAPSARPAHPTDNAGFRHCLWLLAKLVPHCAALAHSLPESSHLHGGHCCESGLTEGC